MIFNISKRVNNNCLKCQRNLNIGRRCRNFLSIQKFTRLDVNFTEILIQVIDIKGATSYQQAYVTVFIINKKFLFSTDSKVAFFGLNRFFYKRLRQRHQNFRLVHFPVLELQSFIISLEVCIYTSTNLPTEINFLTNLIAFLAQDWISNERNLRIPYRQPSIVFFSLQRFP